MRLILLFTTLLVLTACKEDRFSDSVTEAKYLSGEPIQVGEFKGCPIYVKLVRYEQEEKLLYITDCPRIKSIGWTDKHQEMVGKVMVTKYVHSDWLNQIDE